MHQRRVTVSFSFHNLSDQIRPHNFLLMDGESKNLKPSALISQTTNFSVCRILISFLALPKFLLIFGTYSLAKGSGFSVVCVEKIRELCW